MSGRMIEEGTPSSNVASEEEVLLFPESGNEQNTNKIKLVA